MSEDFSFSSASTLLDRLLALDYFHEVGGETAIPFLRTDGTSPLIVIVGDNASGKSFCRRIVQVLCKENKIECMPISAEGRRHISHAPWLTFVYGDEDTQATGVNSMNTVLVGIRTSTNREHQHVIFWDEPDFGLSPSWAAGVGQKLCGFAQEPPDKLVTACVVTHSRDLVRELLPAKPFYLHLGTDPREAPKTLEEWIEQRPVPRNPEDLPGLSHKRFKAIQRILDRKKP